MQTFLRETAETLYNRYGEAISDLHILFPSRRARLFFNDALSGLAGKPLWQPHYRSIDELMEEAAGMRKSDSVRLLAELYAVYSGFHAEPFDKFYRWGEMLLADFDQIDKYRIDAEMLFRNIADLKNLESDLSYLTPEQAEIIRRFWQNFGLDGTASPEKAHFINIWNTLLPIYTQYRERLQEIGLAYPGLIYRTASDKLLENRRPAELFSPGDTSSQPEEIQTLLSRKYAVVGFNALSETEKILFDFLQRYQAAEFFWDYDTYYTENADQEAGLFLRDNLKRFPPDRLSVKPDHFTHSKEIVAVAAPSDAMQTKYVTRFLEELIAAGQQPDKETAIVLTDENLLMSVLYSIPDAVGKVNITMGYPLRQTPAYAFTERLIELQLHKKIKGNTALFYHSEATGLLNHPFIQQAAGEPAAGLAREILERQQVYVPAGRLAQTELLAAIFRPVEGWENLAEYLIGNLTELGKTLPRDENGMQPEFFALILDHLYQLTNTLRGCGLELTDSVFLALLRKNLQTVRVPFEGEPLEGIQVMGILETRNLDFENVVILSVNDDTFPGNLSGSSSFIPYNLRLAYGLPTPQHHEGVYGYYFYRLIQRAKRVHLVYSVKTDDRKTGEPSRYIYQLDFESPHRVIHREMALNISFDPSVPPAISKDETVVNRLQEFLTGGGRMISPSLFYNYVECPLKFYYQGIAGLREAEEISEEVDLPLFGNIFHRAAQLIYRQAENRPDGPAYLKTIIGTAIVDRAIEQAVATEYFNEKDGKAVSPEEYGGNIALIADIVRRYLNTCLLSYDSKGISFEVAATEHKVKSFIPLPVGGNIQDVQLGGYVDRLDRLPDGAYRIVDYKTGQQKNEFKGIDALFSPVHADRNPAVLQTLLYSWMINRETKQEVVPALYFIRFMNREDYSPELMEVITDENGRRKGSQPVHRFTGYREALTTRLTQKLAELFDPAIPFAPCDDLKTCGYCPYRAICNRG